MSSKARGNGRFASRRNGSTLSFRSRRARGQAPASAPAAAASPAPAAAAAVSRRSPDAPVLALALPPRSPAAPAPVLALPPRPPAHCAFPLRVLEPLEPRLLLTGTVYVVNSLLDVVNGTDGQLTLREAIQAANTNAPVGTDAPAGSATETDIIRFAPELAGGTITLNGTQLEVTDELDIQGFPADKLTLDAAGASRVLYVNDVDLSLTGLRVTGGVDPIVEGGGGGVRMDVSVGVSATLVMTDCIVSGNSAGHHGGAIYVRPNSYGSATLRLTHCTVSGNAAGRSGGGIYATGSTLEMVGCTISANATASSGGGICISGSSSSSGRTVSISDCTITGNQAALTGGGVDMAGPADVSFSNCTVSSNRAKSSGGVNVYMAKSLSLINCTVSGNEADSGGGVAARAGVVVITDCTFSDNIVKGSGSALSVYDSTSAGADTLAISGCMITRNHGDGGAAVTIGGCSISMTNTTVTNNSGGGGIAAHRLGATALPMTLRNCDISGNHGYHAGVTVGGMDLNGDQILVAGNSGTTAGGIQCSGGSLTLTDSTVTGNFATGYKSQGGGIFCWNASLTMTRCAVSSNTASEGGGICVRSSSDAQLLVPVTAVITDVVFSENNADRGGAICAKAYSQSLASALSLTMVNCILSANTAQAGAGLLASVTAYNADAVLTVDMRGCAVTGNDAVAGGGGIGAETTVYGVSEGRVDLGLVGCTLSDNQGGYGGGMLVSATSGPVTVDMLNCTVSGNQASSGGGLHVTTVSSGSLRMGLTNCTVTGNVAEQGQGGGIYAASGVSGQAMLNNSIIGQNIASDSADVFDGLCGWIRGSHSLVGSGDGTQLANGLDGNIVGSAASPVDPMLGPLADNGGPTQTHALLFGSPAVDAGNDALTVAPDGTALPADQRGQERFWRAVDMGAYEAQFVGLLCPQAVREGDGVLPASITIPQTLGEDLVLTLQSDDTGEILLPASVTIPAGALSVEFAMTVLDDAVLDGPQQVILSAFSLGQLVGRQAVVVQDNEVALLGVVLPASVTEGEGLLAGAGQVTLPAIPEVDIIVQLTSADPAEIEVPATVTVPAGQTSAAFDITVHDDALLDGTQSVTVTAHVPGWTDGSASVDVLDDDWRVAALVFSPLDSQYSGRSFPITITAVNAHGVPVDFQGPVVLSGRSGQTAIPITPTSVALVDGVWTGDVAVLWACADMQLHASDSTGHTGASNPFLVVGGPVEVDLLPQSDTGVRNDDNVTRFDNGDATRRLQFEVLGTIAGTTVELLANGVPIGSATAAGCTTVVIANDTVKLPDGTHSIVATQRFPDGASLGKSPALAVTIDTVAPRLTGWALTSSGADWGLGRIDGPALTAGRAGPTVPWTGVDRFVFAFDSGVWGAAGSFAAYGGAAGQVPGSAVGGLGGSELLFTLGKALAPDNWALTLTDTVTDQAGNALDGESLGGALPSGDGVPGGHWNSSLSVVRGDVNGDGAVTASDGEAMHAAYGARIGMAGYNAFADLNGDGRVDLSDRGLLRAERSGALGEASEIDAVVAAFAPAGAADAWYDRDGDGDVDPADVEVLVRTEMGTAFGDANLDGRVDLDDLTVLGSFYGMGTDTAGLTGGADGGAAADGNAQPDAAAASSPDIGWGCGDFNGDGRVDLDDLTILGTAYGFDAWAAAIDAPAVPATAVLATAVPATADAAGSAAADAELTAVREASLVALPVEGEADLDPAADSATANASGASPAAIDAWAVLDVVALAGDPTGAAGTPAPLAAADTTATLAAGGDADEDDGLAGLFDSALVDVLACV